MEDFLSDPLKFAAMVAHQLKSPVASVQSILQVLLGEFAGPVTPKQRDLLGRGIEKCDESLLAAKRLLAIASSINTPNVFDGTVDLARLVRRIAAAYVKEARKHRVSLSYNIKAEPALAHGSEEAMTEVIEALLSNAIKYTPDNGKIELILKKDKAAETYILSVSDSGVGIPPESYDRIFEPFYRTPGARSSSRPGTGLGLAFVKAMANAVRGDVAVGKSHLGGAELSVNLKIAKETVTQTKDTEGDNKMSGPIKVVIIGGVAAGPKVAAKIIRLNPDADVTIIERGRLMSYAGCGLPYYISGAVKDQNQLMSSPVGIVRDPVFFQQVKNIHVLNQTEAIEVYRNKKQVRVRNLYEKTESLLEYDKLVFATGSKPVRPDIDGIELGNIFTLHGVTDAEGIKAAVEKGRARDVAIVGGGLIGIEMTEALVSTGCRVTIIEKQPQIFARLDWEMAMLAENHLESKGVRVLTDTDVRCFSGDKHVKCIETDKGTYPADLVIIAVGNLPEISLAKKCGLKTGSTGAIKVNSQMQTSDADIYAVGDCAETMNMLTKEPCYMPLGSTANKQGRVAAINICGGSDEFAGILSTFACKVFDYNVAVTGLTEQKAKSQGFDIVTALVPSPDREHFVSGAKLIMLKLIVDKKTRKLLGATAIGPGHTDKRIDVASTALAAGMTVEQMANLDLCYAPPYSPVMDNIITAANVIRNKLDGYMDGVTPMDVKQMMIGGRDFTLLDVRTPAEYQNEHLADSIHIPLASLRSRCLELDNKVPVVAFCNYSLRGYEAAFILHRAGFDDVRVMDGGLEMWPYEKL